MTTFNTIIEEEKGKMIDHKELHNGVVYWFGMKEFENGFTTAMQRAYEVGVQDTVGEIEKRVNEVRGTVFGNDIVSRADVQLLLKDITSDKK